VTHAFLACLHFLQKRKAASLAGCLALLLACAFFAHRLVVREDVRILLPDGETAAAIQLSYLRQAPFMRTLLITLGGGGHDPAMLANAVASSLRRSGADSVQTGPGGEPTPAALARICPLLPSMLPPADLISWGESLTDATIRALLEKDKAQLISPLGLALRDLIRTDPLRLHERFFVSLGTMRHAAGIFLRNGNFVDAGGMYGLVLVRPQSSMTDTLAAASLMTRVKDALRELPPDAEAYVSGGYRHSEANAAVIKADLWRIMPVSILCLALLFFLFLRTRQALAICAVPLASLCVAATVTALVWGSVSGIVLGFGGVVLGITSDYAIHTYCSISSARDVEKGLTVLLQPLLTALATTCAAFAALFLSAIPAIRQMAAMGLAGVTVAALLSLFFLPLLFRAGVPGCAERVPPDPGSARFLPTFAVAVVLIASVTLGIRELRFDGDIRNMAYAGQDMLHDDERTRAVWQMPSEGRFIVVEEENTPAGRAAAVRSNERVRDCLLRAGIPSSGMASLLPSPERQTESRRVWNGFWETQGRRIRASLAGTAGELGFAPDAFRPFLTMLGNGPKPVNRHTLAATGLDFFLSLYVVETPARFLAYTILPEQAVLDEELLKDISRAGGQYVSGTLFRETMAESIGRDIFRFCLITAAAALFAVAAVFRSPARCALVCLPTLAALAGSLALLHLNGSSASMFHAVALPLVIALSVDYGIFMLAVLEGRLDAYGKKGVLLSALTTLGSFGCLLLARHPALFSIGLTVTVGIGAAVATALLVLPRMAGQGGRSLRDAP
jgi:predicted exporter